MRRPPGLSALQSDWNSAPGPSASLRGPSAFAPTSRFEFLTRFGSVVLRLLFLCFMTTAPRSRFSPSSRERVARNASYVRNPTERHSFKIFVVFLASNVVFLTSFWSRCTFFLHCVRNDAPGYRVPTNVVYTTPERNGASFWKTGVICLRFSRKFLEWVRLSGMGLEACLGGNGSFLGVEVTPIRLNEDAFELRVLRAARLIAKVPTDEHLLVGVVPL